MLYLVLMRLSMCLVGCRPVLLGVGLRPSSSLAGG